MSQESELYPDIGMEPTQAEIPKKHRIKKITHLEQIPIDYLVKWLSDSNPLDKSLTDTWKLTKDIWKITGRMLTEKRKSSAQIEAYKQFLETQNEIDVRRNANIRFSSWNTCAVGEGTFAHRKQINGIQSMHWIATKYSAEKTLKLAELGLLALRRIQKIEGVEFNKASWEYAIRKWQKGE